MKVDFTLEVPEHLINGLDNGAQVVPYQPQNLIQSSILDQYEKCSAVLNLLRHCTETEPVQEFRNRYASRILSVDIHTIYEIRTRQHLFLFSFKVGNILTPRMAGFTYAPATPASESAPSPPPLRRMRLRK